jgi:hypothetical protein
MIEKLRSRHPVDVPAEGFQRSTGLLTVIGGIAALFVLLPLGLALLFGVVDVNARVLRIPVIAAIVVAGATFVLALLVGATRGKPHHARR